jgi:diacylglycerol kinase
MKNKNFLHGVKCAAFGLLYALRTEKNFLVYLIHILITLPLNILVGFSMTQHLLWGVCVIGVFSSECTNTAIEKVCNFINEAYDERIKVIKDIAAGAVCCWGIAFYVSEFIMLGMNLFA